MYSIFDILSATITPDVGSVPKTELTDTTLKDGLSLFFGLIAGVAILVITIAAIEFALSRGNPDKAGKARNTIIYAAIGLGVAVMASVIVRFTIGVVG